MTPVIADTLTTLVRLGCLLVLAAVAGLVIREVKDAHQRGKARVHAGRSWAGRTCCLDARDGLRCDCQPRWAA